MRNNFFYVLLFSLCLTAQTFAQRFTAETGYLYPGEKETEVSGDLEILSGVIKKNDKIDIYAPTGRKFTATITKITGKANQEVAQVKAGEYGYFYFSFTENPLKGNDYIRKGYKVYPFGFQVDTAAMKAEYDAKLSASANFKCTLDGKPFRAKVTYGGKGLKII
jgi:hypothetical protein